MLDTILKELYFGGKIRACAVFLKILSVVVIWIFYKVAGQKKSSTLSFKVCTNVRMNLQLEKLQIKILSKISKCNIQAR